MSVGVVLVVAGLMVGAAVLVGTWLVRGTTAVPAVAWAGLAAGLFLAEEVATAAGRLGDPAARASLRLVVAALAVCPTMSLLGAKRPQHGVWQFIVATLAFVLALPAVSALLVRPGSMPDVHLLERGFFALLLIVGWMNFIGTRHGLAATSATLGLAGLMRAFLPGGDPAGPHSPVIDAIAAAAVAAGAGLAAWQSVWWPAGKGPREGIAAAIDPPFLALRETLGAAWTLRIAERFNAVAGQRRWPCRLRFGGLEQDQAAGPEGWERDAVRCCRALLRRFASQEWIERHCGATNPRRTNRFTRESHRIGQPTQR